MLVSHPLKVVIIDDFQMIINRIATVLPVNPRVSMEGYAVNIPDAIRIIDEKKPDVVIMDINFRGCEPKKGLLVLNMLKETYANMCIIVFTNLSDIRYQRLCISNGADHFLDKATDAEQITQILDSILQATATPSKLV